MDVTKYLLNDRKDERSAKHKSSSLHHLATLNQWIIPSRYIIFSSSFVDITCYQTHNNCLDKVRKTTPIIILFQLLCRKRISLWKNLIHPSPTVKKRGTNKDVSRKPTKVMEKNEFLKCKFISKLVNCESLKYCIINLILNIHIYLLN